MRHPELLKKKREMQGRPLQPLSVASRPCKPRKTVFLVVRKSGMIHTRLWFVQAKILLASCDASTPFAFI